MYICIFEKVYIYIYIYIFGEMGDFGKSDKIRKISGKVDKPDIDIGFYNVISSLLK